MCVNRSVFVSGNGFPSSFEMLAKKIHRYLFQVLAHIYGFHYREIVCLALHPHLNTLFLHFMTFNFTFNILEEKETEILDDLYKKLTSGQIKDSTVPSEGNNVANGDAPGAPAGHGASQGDAVNHVPKETGDMCDGAGCTPAEGGNHGSRSPSPALPPPPPPLTAEEAEEGQRYPDDHTPSPHDLSDCHEESQITTSVSL